MSTISRRMFMAKANARKVRGCVKVALGSRGMMMEAARQYANDRKEWRALVQM